ncbi:FAD:protein FMN transferase [Microbacterium sp. NPDC012755]|uniref:FAD:protein FMN transferase n=1 Tax=Microbacterium sp. NPDC012755 TaxID=3364184 RepID=UPI0036778795
MTIWRFDAIGTRWEIEGELSSDDRAAVAAEIERFDREWSRFRSDSDVTRLAAHGGRLTSPDAGPMLSLYRELSTATAGAVDPLVGAGLEALGYDAAYSLRAGDPVAAPSDWTSLVSWSDRDAEVSSPVLLDVGALGKGRLVDLVFGLLAYVPGDLVVDAAGDLRVRGSAVRIGLEHPFDPTKAVGIVSLQDAALCASAINRRAWGDGLHHVLDARTGVPVQTWAATWAIGADAMRADAVATALFFDGGPELADDWGVEWVRMTTDGRIERSADCRAELFVARP